MKKTTALFLLALALLLTPACGDDDDNTGGTEPFTAGNFLVTATSVNDGCFDGAMNTIVIPDGVSNDFPAPIAFPAYSALPAAIDITFSAPFQSVTGIAVEASGANGWKTSTGFAQTGVSIVAEGQDCLADMMATAELVASDNDHFTGIGTLTISSATGADCPVFTTPAPCEVEVTLTAVRQ